MSRKRERGHIRERSPGSFEIRYSLGQDPLTGRRKVATTTFRGVLRDAKKELTRLLAAVDANTHIDTSRVTVSEFLDRWERDWVAGNVSGKTAERYIELLRLHVRPHIGATILQKLKTADLAALYGKLLREGRGESRGLAPRTVGHVHRVLHRAIGHAAQWGLLQSNVVANVSPPRVAATEIEILRADQVRAVREALGTTWLGVVVSTALGTGLRRGEILALRWRDIDLFRNDRARLRVEQALEQTKAGGLKFKAPKTRHGRRTIALPDYLAVELRAHWKTQQETRLALGLGKAADDDLVFPGSIMEPLSPRALSKRWEAAADGLKLSATFHALRHTHASQLIAAGMDVLTISRRLGHSSPKITLEVYGHLFENSDDRAAQIMDAAFSSARSENLS